ncbi:MAG: oligosaccharide flippase family protein [Gammaproteobacteria bacterium]
MSFRATLIKGFFSLGAIKSFSMAIGLLITMFLARALGADAFGQYAFVMALVPLLAIPAAGGLSQLLTREIAAFRQGEDWSLFRGAVRASHVWVLLVAVVVIALYWLGVSLFGWDLTSGKWAIFPLALLLLPISGLNAIRNGVLRGLGMPVYASLPGLLIQPVVFLSLLGLLWFLNEVGLASVVLVQICAALITLGVAAVMYRRVVPEPVGRATPQYELKRWGASLLPFASLAMVGTFNAQLGIVVVGLLSSDEQVAAMRIAERGAQLVGLSLTLVNLVIAPHIVTAYRKGNSDLLQKLSRKSARGGFLFAAALGVPMILAGGWLIRIVFGAQYVELAYVPLVIIVCGQLLNVFCGSVGYMLQMSGHERDSLSGQVLAVILNVALCAALVPAFGAVGAAIGVSVALLIRNGVLSWLVVKRLGIRPTAL